MTVGAEPAVFDMVSRDAGLFEEAAVRIVQIEEVLPIGFFDRKTRYLLLIEELIEFLYHFLTHLEALQSDRRTDRTQDILPLRAVVLLHLRHRERSDIAGCPPPASMRQRDRPLHRIVEKERRAVGIIHRDRDILLIRHEAITGRDRRLHRECAASGILLRHLVNVGAMHLISRDKARGGKPQCLEIAAAVLTDRIRIVARMEAHIQRGKWRLTHPASAA